MRIYYPQARAHLIWWPYTSTAADSRHIEAAFDPTLAAAVGDPERTIERAMDQLVAISNVQPRSVSVEHNDVFTADTFDVEFDEYLFRVDPRDVRALMVDIRMGGTDAPTTPLPVGADDPRQLYGHADEVTQSYQTDGASTIKAKGRDYTGILLDETWQGRRLELGRPLSELIAEALDPVLALRPLEVVTAPGLEDAVIPKGARRRDHFFTASPDASLWEGLLELTMRAGLMLVVEVDRLVLQPPRNVLAQEQARTPLFVEGRDIKELTIERNLGTADLPAVQIAAYDRASGQVVRGTWPPERKVARLTKGKRSEDKTVQRFFVRATSPTEDALTAIAQRVFSLYARQQLEVSFTTHELAIASGDGAEQHNQRGAGAPRTPSTAIRNGTAIRVRLDPRVRNVLARDYSPQKSVRELRAQGYAPQVAAMLARSWRPLERLLFVSRATHRFSDGEYELKVSAQNFITI